MTFSRPTLSEIDTRIRGDVRSALGISAVVRRTWFHAFARALAGAAHSLHGHLREISKQAFPDQAEGIYLKRWGSIYGVPAKEATFPVLTVGGTGTDGKVIPVDTVLQIDDGSEYWTDAEVTVAASVWSVNVTSQNAGADFNLENGETMSFQTPISGVDPTATVSATITEGEDSEEEEAQQTRIVQRIQQPPAGGKATDYLAWALEVAGVTRAWVFPGNRGQGSVDVSFVEDGEVDIIPGAAKVDEVQLYIDERKPVTADHVTFAPVELTVDMTIQITPNTQAVRDAITAELEDLFFREAEVSGALDPDNVGTFQTLDGVIEISKINESISIAAGEEDHVLVTPTADVEPDQGNIAILGTITFQTLV